MLSISYFFIWGLQEWVFVTHNQATPTGYPTSRSNCSGIRPLTLTFKKAFHLTELTYSEGPDPCVQARGLLISMKTTAHSYKAGN